MSGSASASVLATIWWTFQESHFLYILHSSLKCL